MSTAEDFAAARKSGFSDDEILKAYREQEPGRASEIDEAIKGGYKPSEILTGLQEYQPNQSSAQTVTDWGSEIKNIGLTGLRNLAGGYAKTAQVAGLVDKNAVSSTEKVLSPDANYVEHAQKAHDAWQKGDYKEFAKQTPGAVAEDAPGIGVDLAAGGAGAAGGAALGSFVPILGTGVGAVLGGAAGFGGSYLARHLGRNAQTRADARTGHADSDVTGGDIGRAAATTAVDAAISRVGLKGLPAGSLGGRIAPILERTAARGAGAGPIATAATNTLKGAVGDAGANAAISAVDSVGLKGEAPNLSDMAESAAGGVLPGAIARGAHGLAEGRRGVKFRDIDPEGGADLAQLYESKPFGTTKEAFNSVSDVDRDLARLNSGWSKRVAPQLKALETASEGRDNTWVHLDRVQEDVAAGRPVRPEDMAVLTDRLGDFHEGQGLLQTIKLQDTQNKVKAAGGFNEETGTFGSGLADSRIVQQAAHSSTHGLGGALNRHGLLGTGIASMIPGAHQFFTVPAMATLAAQRAVRPVARIADAISGRPNPLEDFLGRFRSETSGGQDGGTGFPAEGLPSFQHVQRQQQEQARAEAAKASEDAKATGEVADKTAIDVGELARKTLLSQRAQKEAQEDLGRLLGGESTLRGQSATEAASGAPRGPSVDPRVYNDGWGEDSTSPSPNLKTVSHRGFDVHYDPGMVGNRRAYEAGVRGRIEDRGRVLDEARKAHPEAKDVYDQIESDLNAKTVSSKQAAQRLIEEYANNNPDTAKIIDNLNKKKLWSTFDAKSSKSEEPLAAAPRGRSTPKDWSEPEVSSSSKGFHNDPVITYDRRALPTKGHDFGREVPFDDYTVIKGKDGDAMVRNPNGTKADVVDLGKPVPLSDRVEMLKDMPGFKYIPKNLRNAVNILGKAFDELGAGDVPVYTLNKSNHDAVYTDKNGNGAMGLYMPDSDVITHSPAVSGNTQWHVYTILHEGVHAAAVRAMRNDPEINRTFNDLFSYVSDHGDKLTTSKLSERGKYGMSNVDEFVAEAMSNREFQKHLSTIPLDERWQKFMGLSSGTKQSVWTAFKEMIRFSLGLSNTKEIRNVLDGVIHAFDKHHESIKGSAQRKRDTIARHTLK